MQPMNQGPPGMQPMAQPQMPQGVPGSPDQEQVLMSLTPEQRMKYDAAGEDQKGSVLAALMGGFGARAQGADNDMSRANALRQDQRATGQTVGPGNIYVGASPLEHAADAMRGYQGMKDFKEAKTAREAAWTGDEDKRMKGSELMMNLPGSMLGNILRGS